MKYLLYGANGYTASLILEQTREFGVTPILGGRSKEKLKTLADQTGYAIRVFDLDDPNAIDQHLTDVDVVLHCAGPFLFTAKPMMEACLRTGTHYLDITGEVDVFEMGHQFNEAAKAAGILIMPGVGFDVVPTDCVAGYLKEKLPDANRLVLSFAQSGGMTSQGTAKTIVENLGNGGMIRKDGKLIKVPTAFKTRTIDFGPFKRQTATIPWGDISTAYHHTGIPNIEVYMAIPPKAIKMMKIQRHLEWMLRSRLLKNWLKKQIEKRPAGPDPLKRKASNMYVYGEVENASGEKASLRIRCPEGYTLTAWMALNITKKVLSGKAVPGFYTPAGLFGHALVFEMPEVEII